MFENQQYRSLYLNCNKNLGKLGNLHISTLRVKNKIIAGHWGFYTKDTFYYIMPSYESGIWAKYSPGKILLEYLMEWACKNRIKTFDFTEGYANYKKNWSNTKIFLHSTIVPFNFKANLILFIYKLKGIMPDRLTKVIKLIFYKINRFIK